MVEGFPESEAQSACPSFLSRNKGHEVDEPRSQGSQNKGALLISQVQSLDERYKDNFRNGFDTVVHVVPIDP